jgi:hypothetical protein
VGVVAGGGGLAQAMIDTNGLFDVLGVVCYPETAE